MGGSGTWTSLAGQLEFSCTDSTTTRWITGAGNLDCKIMILMGKTDPTAEKYGQQSQILVPMDTPGITLLRPMTAFGDDDAPSECGNGLAQISHAAV